MPAVRINRYLAAAGLGTRREVEGLLRTGRVMVDGTPCFDPSTRVTIEMDVLLDGDPLRAPAGSGVLLFRPAAEEIGLVHPGVLVAVLPSAGVLGGAELLFADQSFADRLADPRFPLTAHYNESGQRIRLGGIALDDLEPGQWRPLAPREIAKLRRGARLPPRAG